MTRFFIVRHGQSVWNAEGRWQGLSDPPLSDKGRREAKLAAPHLDGFDGIVFASPLLRARETAEILAAELGGKPVTLSDDLREIDVGAFSGLTNDEIQQRLPEAWSLLRAGKLLAFPDGEARADFRLRVLRALDAIALRHPGSEVLAVAHGGAIAEVERHLGVHPGVPVRNLTGRWFELGDELEVCGDRVALFDDQPS